MKGFYCLMQNKYIAKRRKGKHLTLAERAKIVTIQPYKFCCTTSTLANS